MKTAFRVTDVAIDLWCRLVHFILLPHGNLFPPSFHLMKAVLAVPDARSVTRHVCTSCWKLYPDTRRPASVPDAHERCQTPGCPGVRYTPDLAGRLIPDRSVYYFGASQTVGELIRQPGILKQLKAERENALEDKTSFLYSPAGRALDKATGFRFTKPRNDEFALLLTIGAGPYGCSSMRRSACCYRRRCL